MRREELESPREDEFVRELIDRLSDDIIQYAEVFGVSHWLYPTLHTEQRLERIINAVDHLLEQGAAVVGETKIIDGIIHVIPWAEQGAELNERLRTAVYEFPNPSLGDGFWLSRPH
jgi:hypothetical protein